MRDCTFEGNRGWGGGAVHNTGSPVISGCTFVGNEGVFGILYNGGTVRLENCTFAVNSSDFGVMYNKGGATVVNCTFFDNSGLLNGGINNAEEGRLTLRNTLLADNTSLSGDEDCHNVGSIAAARNLIEHGYAGIGNITGEQPDLRLGTFDFHGGPTKTYALLPGSVAIDAGNCNYAPPV